VNSSPTGSTIWLSASSESQGDTSSIITAPGVDGVVVAHGPEPLAEAL
jgi:hypothetical protein